MAGDESYAGRFYGDGGSTIDLNGHRLTLDSAAGNSVNGVVLGPGTLNVAGTLDDAGMTVTAGALVRIAGVLTQSGNAQIGTSTTDSGTFDVVAGGTYDIVTDTQIGASGTVAIDNAGLFEKTGNTGQSNIYAPIVNTGTVAAAMGLLALQSSLENDALVTVASSLYVAGAVTAATGLGGTIAISGGGRAEFAGTVAAAETVTFGAGGGDLQLAEPGSFSGTIANFGTGDTIDLFGTVANAFTLSGTNLALFDVLNGATTTVTVLALTGVTASASIDLALDPAGNGTAITFGRSGTVFVTPTASTATDSWTASSGSWTTATNWSAGLPGSLDNAYLQTNGTVTFDTTATVNYLQTGGSEVLNQTGETLTVNDGGQVGASFAASGGTLDAVNGLSVAGGVSLAAAAALLADSRTLTVTGGGTIAGTLGGAGEIDLSSGSYAIAAGAVIDAGTFGLRGGGSMALGGDVSDAATVTIDFGNNVILNGHTLTLGGPAFLYGGVAGPGVLKITGTAQDDYFRAFAGATLDDAGTVLQVGNNAPTFDGALLTIEAGATWDILSDTPIVNNGTLGTIVNAGLFEKSEVYGTTQIYDPFVNAGTLAVGTGGIVATYPTVALYAGGTLDGTLSGFGEIDLDGGTFDLGPTAFTVARFGILNGTQTTLTAGATYAGGFTLGYGSGLALDGQTLTLAGAQNMLAGGFGGTGEIVVQGSADAQYLLVDQGATLGDAGLITQDVQITVDNALLQVDSTATYDLIVDSGIGNLGTLGTIDNLGLFEKTDGTGQSSIVDAFVNSGTLDAVRSTIALYAGGLLDGTIEGAGELDLRGGTIGQYTLAAGAVLSVATLGLYDGGSSLLLAGNATYGGRLILGSAGITMGGYTLTLSGSNDVLSSYNINDGVIAVTGTADIANETIEALATLAAAGLLTQDGNIVIGNSTTDSSAIAVDGSGTYDLLSDNQIAASGTATVANAGLFEKTGYDGASNVYATFDNTGTLDAAHGTMALYGGGALGGTIEGARELDLRGGTIGQYTLAAGAVLSVATLALYDSGTGLLLAGNETYGGHLILGSAGITMGGFTLTLSGTNDSLGYYNINDGVINVAGTADIGNATIDVNATLQGGKLITQDGYVQLGSSTTDNAAIVIDAGATYELLNDTYINSSGTAAIANAGLFVKTGVAYSSDIYPVVTNTGTLEVDRGTLVLYGGGTLGGTLSGGGTLALEGGAAESYTLSAGLALDVANLLLYGGSYGVGVRFGGSASYGGALTLWGASLDVGGSTLTLAGSAQFGVPGYVSNVGTIKDGRVVVVGSGDVAALTIAANATVEDAGTLSQDGSVYLGGSSADTTALVVDSGATDALISDSANIYGNGTAVIDNAGLFEKVGATGISYISPVFVNTGTLLAASGTVVLEGGGTLGGTVAGGGALELYSSVSGSQMTLGASAVLTVASLQVVGSYGALLAGNVTYGGNFWLDSGSLALAGHTLTLTGAATLAGTVSGAGEIDLGGGTLGFAMLTGGVTLVDVGSLLQDGNVSFGAVTSNAMLSVAKGATYDIVSDVSLLNGSSADPIGNSGLFEKTGLTGASEISGGFTNTGTVLATTGTLDFLDPANDVAGTLSGGVWDAQALGTAGTIALGGSAIATDAADIELDGAAAAFTAGGTAIEQSLTAVGAAGTLGIADGRAFVTTQTLTDSGLIRLNQGTLVAAALTIATGGALAGNGSVTDPVNNGTITASGGTLLIASAVGGTGVLQVDSGAALELGGAVGSSQTVDLQSYAALRLDDPTAFAGTLENLQGGDSLHFHGTAAIGVTITGTTLQVTLTGGTTLDFALLTPAAGLSVGIGANGALRFSSPGIGGAVPPTVAPLTIDLGEAHVGTTLAQVLTVTNVATVGSAETLDGGFTTHSVGVLAGGAITGLGPTQSDTLLLLVGLDTTFSGLHSGTAVASFSLDPSGTPIATDTVQVAGTVFALATANLGGSTTINIGPQHLGTTDTGVLTLINAAGAGAYSEALDANFVGATGIQASGSVSLLAAGTTSTALGVSLLQSSTLGTATGQVTLALTSDGTGIDTLGTTALATQTLTVLGTFENFATARLYGYSYSNGSTITGSGTNYVLDFGTLSQGGSQVFAYFYATNQATGPADSLAGSFTMASSVDLASISLYSFSSVGAGGYSPEFYFYASPTIAGAISDTITLTPASELGTTPFALAPITLTVTADVLPAITPPTIAPGSIDFGQHHVGDTIEQALSVTNPATAGSGISLDVSAQSLTSYIYASGSISALAPQASDSTALQVSLYPYSATIIDGPVQIAYDETGATNTSGYETVNVAGTLFAFATASVVGGTTLNLGATHVGTAETGALTLLNAATAGTLGENLDASLTGAGAGLTTGGTVALLAAGASSNALGVTLTDASAGTLLQTATFAPVSDGSGIDTLGTTALAPQTITVEGTFSDYATAAFANIAGPGTLSSGGASWTLDLGTLALGGAGASDTLGVRNTAVGPADSLAAAFLLGGAGFTTGGFGGFTAELAGSQQTVGTIGIAATTAGTFTETVTLTPTSELSGGAPTLAAETLTVRAVVTSLTPPVIARDPVSFGEVRLNQSVKQGLTVTNAATAGSGETLDLSIAGASPVTAAGTITGLVPGAISAGALTVGLLTSQDGVESGGAVVTYVRPSTSATGTATVDVSGTVFAPATLHLSAATIDLGLTHVGQTLTGALGIGNSGSADGFTEKLDAALAGAGSGLTTSGTIAGLAAAASGSFGLILSGTVAGTSDHTLTVSATSDGAGVDTLGLLGLTSQTVDVLGTFSNFATADFTNVAGPGTVSGSGAAWTLDLGTLLIGTSPLADVLGVKNAAVGLADSLDGGFALGAAGAFTDGGFATFSGEKAGSTDTAGTISIVPTAAGTFTETVTLTPTSVLGGTGTTLSPETLTVTAVVAKLTPPTITPSPLDFGQVRQNQVVEQGLTVANVAKAGSGETLDLHIASISAPGFILPGDTITNLVPGQTIASTLGSGLGIGIGTSNPGKDSGTADIIYGLSGAPGVTSTVDLSLSATGSGTIHETFTATPTSDGLLTIDTLTPMTLSPKTIDVVGTFYNYATATVGEASGSGVLSGGGSSYTLDFGTLALGGPSVSALLDIGNSAVGLADSLDASYGFGGGALFSNPAGGGFTGVAAGTTIDVSGPISFDPSATGSYSETFTLTPVSDGPVGKTPQSAVTVTIDAVVATGPTGTGPTGTGQTGHTGHTGQTGHTGHTGQTGPSGPGAGMGGDPHYVGFDGLHFDFQASGEFVLVKSADFEVQVRQEPNGGASAPQGFVGFVDQIGMRVGTDRVTIDNTRAVAVWINGTPVALAPNQFVKLSGGTVYALAYGSYAVVWNTGEQVRMQGTSVAVYLDGHTAGVQGLLGPVTGNPATDLQLPDGTVLQQPLSFSTLFQTFADAWRVTQATSLLDYAPGQTTATFTNTSFPPSPISVADLPQSVIQQAQAAIAALGITDPQQQQNAILDYVLSGGNSSVVAGDLAQQQGGLVGGTALQTLAAPAPDLIGINAPAGTVTVNGTAATSTSRYSRPAVAACRWWWTTR